MHTGATNKCGLHLYQYYSWTTASPLFRATSSTLGFFAVVSAQHRPNSLQIQLSRRRQHPHLQHRLSVSLLGQADVPLSCLFLTDLYDFDKLYFSRPLWLSCSQNSTFPTYGCSPNVLLKCFSWSLHKRARDADSKKRGYRGERVDRRGMCACQRRVDRGLVSRQHHLMVLFPVGSADSRDTRVHHFRLDGTPGQSSIA